MWVEALSPTEPSTTDVSALAADMYLAYTTHFAPVQGGTIKHDRCRVTYFTSDVDVVILGEHSGSSTGTAVGGSNLDAGAAITVTWDANVFWRGGKPRTYLPGPLTTNLLDTSHFSQAYINSVFTAANAYLTQVNTLTSGVFTDVSLGLVSFFSKQPTAIRPKFFPITAARVGSRVDHQRRRVGAEVI